MPAISKIIDSDVCHGCGVIIHPKSMPKPNVVFHHCGRPMMLPGKNAIKHQQTNTNSTQSKPRLMEISGGYFSINNPPVISIKAIDQTGIPPPNTINKYMNTGSHQWRQLDDTFDALPLFLICDTRLFFATL